MIELSMSSRVDAVDQMGERPLDVLVIGGGVTGAGCALDAALRGLRVGLVERSDFASGTSSRSSKMIHGGLRYLAKGDVGLVREALRERRCIQQHAAHMVRPLPMVLPMYGWKSPLHRMKLGTGLWAYDLLGAWRAGVRHDWLDTSRTLRVAPNLDPQGLVGAMTYSDSQADDARLVLAIIRTAATNGALVANGADVVELLEDRDRVVGARVAIYGSGPVDGSTVERTVDIEAGVVINATGVWSDRLYGSTGQDPGFEVMPSKGIHLTVNRQEAGIESGLAFVAQTGTNVFIEPWQDDLAIIGTSDTPFDGDVSDPQATDEDIGTLLATVNAFLRNPIARSGIIASWAGLRPLVKPTGSSPKRSQDVSRRHRTIETPGLVTLVGGKLTTYRTMAQDGVDAAVSQLDHVEARPCTTDAVPLDGATLTPTSANVDDLVAQSGWERSTIRHLIRRYGSRTPELISMCTQDPDLADRLHPDRPYIAAEAVYGYRYEMARMPDDVIARRTRISIETRDGGESVRDAVASLAADRTH